MLPLDIGRCPDDVELARFSESRRIPKGRVYFEEALRPFGLAPADTKGIIDLSRGTSVSDTYSVVPVGDDVPYCEYNLFDNDFDEVEYGLTEWRGRLCSTCELFNTPDVSFAPFDLCLPADLARLCDLDLALAWFSDVGEGAAEAFRSMAVFDFVIANTDRHTGNFGVLRDNQTGTVLDAAPVFDNNMALFPRDADEWLEPSAMEQRLAVSPGILDAPLDGQGRAMLGRAQRFQLERLVDFRFDGGGFIEEYRAANPRGKIMNERIEALLA